MELNLDNFDAHFPDEQSCIDYLTKQRWPTGIACLTCGSVSVYHLKRRQAYECKDCGKQFSVRTAMPFEGSKVPLRKWLKALFLFTSRKRGESSLQLADDIHVTQKTAWHMEQALREFMGEENVVLSGDIELDETFVHPNVYKRSSAKRKFGRTGSRTGEILFGMTERGGRTKIIHVKSTGARVLNPLIDKHIAKGSRIFSDEHGSYRLLSRRGYDHHTTNHSRCERVIDYNHTQNIENQWSHLKRTIKGTYYHVSPKYIGRYADEVAFRLTTRSLSNEERLRVWLANCWGKRVAHKTLTQTGLPYAAAQDVKEAAVLPTQMQLF